MPMCLSTHHLRTLVPSLSFFLSTEESAPRSYSQKDNRALMPSLFAGAELSRASQEPEKTKKPGKVGEKPPTATRVTVPREVRL